MTASTIGILFVFFAVTAAAAAFGAVFQPGTWYQGLEKPPWTPPNWLFGPVWAVLYIMIAVSGWLVWREQGFSLVVALWVVQLVLNGAWSWIMFGQHQIGWALADIVFLWIAIIVFAVLAWPVSATASLLFFPYLAWVSYAGALNFAIWRLNS